MVLNQNVHSKFENSTKTFSTVFLLRKREKKKNAAKRYGNDKPGNVEGEKVNGAPTKSVEFDGDGKASPWKEDESFRNTL